MLKLKKKWKHFTWYGFVCENYVSIIVEYGLEGKRSLHFWVCAFAPLKKRKIKFVKSSWFSRKLKLAIAGIGPRNKLKIHSVTRNCSDLSLISKFLQISQSQSIAIQRNDDCFSRLWYGKSVSNWHICFDPSNRSSLQFLNYFDNHISGVNILTKNQ